MLTTEAVIRRLVSLGGNIAIDSYGMRAEGLWASSDSYIALNELDPLHSVAILGEPGIGKSTALRELIVHDQSTVTVHLDEVADVRHLSGLLDPIRTITGPVTLVLDGVDECPLPPKSLARTLTGALAGREELRVLVGCRIADWPTDLADQLAEALGGLLQYELLPLSASDATALATANGLDGARFLDAVRAVGAGALAAIPLTLGLLIDQFRAEDHLPADPTYLYEHGLTLLARDPDRSRAPQNSPSGSPELRVAIASRLSAALLLCGKSAVVVEGAVGDNELAAGALAGGRERLPAGDHEVTDELVHSTLSTALFSGRGHGRLGVTHASFAAFLAAKYLHTHGVPEHQLRALLTRSSVLGRVSVPTHLREVAAWLVALDSSCYAWIVDIDPDALLSHSLLMTSPTVRRQLAATLLEESRLAGERLGRVNLAHDGLLAQLEPALLAPLTEDAGPHFGNPVSRRAALAIDLADNANLTAASPYLADLVARTTLNSYLRAHAAYALVRLDAEAARSVLRPVLTEVQRHPDRDPEDQLRGIALNLCWPGQLTPAELIEHLTTPQDANFIGSYAMFLRQLVERLTHDQVRELTIAIVALQRTAGDTADVEWQEDHELRGPGLLVSGTRRSADLLSALLYRGLSSTDLVDFVDDVGWLLAEAMLQHVRPDLPRRFAIQGDDATTELRRSLALRTLDHMPATRGGQLVWGWNVTPAAEAAYVRHGLIGSDDLDWIFTLESTPYADHAVLLLRQVFDPMSRHHQDVAWSRRDTGLFTAAIPWAFAPVELDGQAAADMRENHRWAQRQRGWAGKDEHLALLSHAWSHARDAEAFAELLPLMRIDLESGSAETHRFQSDMRNWGGWSYLELSDEEVAPFAVQYLTSHACPAGPWREQPDRYSPRVLDGYAAFCLLASATDPQAWLSQLPSSIWADWAPGVIRAPSDNTSVPSSQARSRLLQQCALNAPETFADDYLSWVHQSVCAGWSIPELAPLDAVYAAEVETRLNGTLNELLAQLRAAEAALGALSATDDKAEFDGARARLNIARQGIDDLASYLLGHDASTTITLLRETWSDHQAGTRERCAAGVALLTAGELDWPAVLSAAESNEALGRAFVVQLASFGTPMSSDLLNGSVVELWSWIDARWPSTSDEQRSGFVDEEASIRRWRDELLRELARRATPADVEALATLASGHPDNVLLQSLTDEAESRQRDASWLGPTWDQLSSLIEDARRSIVNDDDSLFRLLLVAIGTISDRLSSLGHLLWDETRAAQGAGRVWRPKPEAAVSALLADLLTAHLGSHVVVNREVQVRETTSRGHGLAVDVLATSLGSAHDSIRCPIEVKGSWNPGLLSDLKNQLVDDYMPSVSSNRGIYVCAWFPTEQWDDDDDTRRTVASRRDRDKVKAELLRVAEEVSVDGVGVGVVVLDITRPRRSTRAQ